MILLLEKCWESKGTQELQELPSNAPITQPNKGKISSEVSKITITGEKRSNSPEKKQSGPVKAVLVEEAQDKPAKTKQKKAKGSAKEKFLTDDAAAAC